MDEKIPVLLEKLKLVFDVLNFPQGKKEKLLSELLDGSFTLAMTKTIKGNPDLEKKLKEINTQNLIADKPDSLSEVISSKNYSQFANELQAILNDYISEISTTVDANRKQKIQGIWNSTERATHGI